MNGCNKNPWCCRLDSAVAYCCQLSGLPNDDAQKCTEQLWHPLPGAVNVIKLCIQWILLVFSDGYRVSLTVSRVLYDCSFIYVAVALRFMKTLRTLYTFIYKRPDGLTSSSHARDIIILITFIISSHRCNQRRHRNLRNPPSSSIHNPQSLIIQPPW